MDAAHTAHPPSSPLRTLAGLTAHPPSSPLRPDAGLTAHPPSSPLRPFAGLTAHPPSSPLRLDAGLSSPRRTRCSLPFPRLPSYLLAALMALALFLLFALVSANRGALGAHGDGASNLFALSRQRLEAPHTPPRVPSPAHERSPSGVDIDRTDTPSTDGLRFRSTQTSLASVAFGLSRGAATGAASTSLTGISADTVFRAREAALLRFVVTDAMVADVRGLKLLYNLMESREATWLLDLSIDKIFSARHLERLAAYQYRTEEGAAPCNLVPAVNFGLRSTITLDILRARMLYAVRESLSALLTTISKAFAALSSTGALTDGYPLALAGCADAVVALNEWYAPSELNDAGVGRLLDSTIADVTLRSRIHRALEGPNTGDAASIVSATASVLRQLAATASDNLALAKRHDSGRTRITRSAAAAAALTEASGDDGQHIAAMVTTTPNLPTTTCQFGVACRTQHLASSDGILPLCRRGGHGTPTSAGVRAAQAAGALRVPPRSLTAKALAVLALAAVSALPAAQAREPPAAQWDVDTGSPALNHTASHYDATTHLNAWDGVLAAALGEGRGSNANGLVTTSILVGSTPFTVLLDGGATFPAVRASVFEELQRNGSAQLTGQHIRVAAVSSQAFWAPLASITYSHPSGAIDRTANFAVLQSLLAGHEHISMILPAPGDPTATIQRFWHPPAPAADDDAHQHPDDAAAAAFVPAPMPSTTPSSAPAPGSTSSQPNANSIGTRAFSLADLLICSPEQGHWLADTGPKLLAILNRYRGVFAPLDALNAPLNYPLARVTTTSEAPYDASRASVWRQFTPSQYASFNDTVDRLVASGHATWVDASGGELDPAIVNGQPANPAWAPSGAPARQPMVHAPVCVGKGDGGARVAIDFRRLNDITPDPPITDMPSVDALLSAMAGAACYSSADAKDYHYQLLVHPDDRHKSCFSTPRGIVRLNAVGQGWKLASVIAQRVAEAIVGPLGAPSASHRNPTPAPAPPATPATVYTLPWAPSGLSTTEPYQDDFGQATGNGAAALASPAASSFTFGTALHDLELLLWRCQLFNLRLSFSKARFLQPTLHYLGETLSAAGRAIDPERIAAIRGMPLPSTFVEASAGISTMGYYGRKFVLNFAHLHQQFLGPPEFRSAIANPTAADRRARPMALLPQQVDAWLELRAAPGWDYVLAAMDHRYPVVIAGDASMNGLGGFILVGPDFRCFTFFSKALTDTQKRYSVPRLEVLAGVEIFRRFFHAIKGALRILWLFDHANIEHFVRARLAGAPTRDVKIGAMLDYVFHDLGLARIETVCIPGAQNIVPDGCSRLPVPEHRHVDSGPQPAAALLSAPGDEGGDSPRPWLSPPSADTMALAAAAAAARDALRLQFARAPPQAVAVLTRAARAAEQEAGRPPAASAAGEARAARRQARSEAAPSRTVSFSPLPTTAGAPSPRALRAPPTRASRAPSPTASQLPSAAASPAPLHAPPAAVTQPAGVHVGHHYQDNITISSGTADVEDGYESEQSNGTYSDLPDLVWMGPGPAQPPAAAPEESILPLVSPAASAAPPSTTSQSPSPTAGAPSPRAARAPASPTASPNASPSSSPAAAGVPSTRTSQSPAPTASPSPSPSAAGAPPPGAARAPQPRRAVLEASSAPAYAQTLVPGHLTTAPFIAAVAAAQAGADPTERAAWETTPGFASTAIGSILVVTWRHALWLPSCALWLKRVVLEAAHCSIGYNNGTAALVHALHIARVAWRDMRLDVASWIASSPQRQHAVQPRPNAPSSSTSAPRGSFEPTLAPHVHHTLYIDYFGPLDDLLPSARSAATHKGYILLIVDAFSRWVELLACPAADSAGAIAGLDRWGKEVGSPLVVRSDGARAFDCAPLKRWCLAQGIEGPIIGAPLHAAGQGPAERRMAELAKTLKVLAAEQPTATIDTLLPVAARRLNDAPCRASGFSAFHLVYGHPRRSHLAAVVGLPPFLGGIVSHVQHLHALHATQQLGLVASGASQLTSKSYDDSHPHASFKPGDYVLYLADTATKLQPVGVIHVVHERIGASEYSIARPFTPDERHRVATERIIPYDASRTDLVADATRFLLPGTSLITEIVGHTSVPSTTGSGMPTITYTVRHPGGSTSSGWTADNLRRIDVFKRYCAALAAPPASGGRPRGRPPKPGGVAALRRAAAVAAAASSTR